MTRLTALLAILVLAAPAAAQEEASEAPPPMRSELVASHPIPEANQGVGVDAEHFYAVDNRTIAKYDKETLELVGKVEFPEGGPIAHFDSAAVVDGRVYLAHSNYPEWPMTSSVEVFDAETLEHVESHSFGIDRGSFTWMDRDAEGRWWGTYANYNRVFDRSPVAYGNKFNTQVVRFDEEWRVAEAWVIPEAVVERFEDMSNSGGLLGARRAALPDGPRPR